jgi:cyclophilin family peptidyl-prolyl cis-trans isomerase
MTRFLTFAALVVSCAAPLSAQGDTPAKLWKEIDALVPRRAGPVPVPMPSLAIDWNDKITKAEELLVRSADTPVEPYAMFYLGSFYFEGGRFDEAKAMFETIIKNFPKHQLVTFSPGKDLKPLAVQAFEDCASEVSFRARNPRPDPVAPVLDPGVTATITFSTGVVKIKFFRNVAPKHFESFVNHVKAGDYDGTKVGQTVPDQLVGAGDPASKLPPPPGPVKADRPTTPAFPGIPHEFSALSHQRGMVSMTRSITGNESSGVQLQFFLKDQAYFDFTDTIFAKVVEGMEVLEAISKTPRPQVNEITIKGIAIDGL